jgi:hypothetical protein
VTGGEHVPVITDEFRLANYYEAALWAAIAVGAAVLALIRAGHVRRRCAVLAVTLAAFGVSDVVETRTGAWWRPWWLLAWKAACVAVLVALLAEHYSRRRTSSKANAAATP